VRTDQLLRIGELSRRSGVSPELLRAWERRYGLLQPTRSAGGLRLYSAVDLERVRAMQRLLAEGLAAAEAAALVSQPAPSGAEVALAPVTTRSDLGAALSSFDERRAHAIIDTLLAATTLDWALAEVIVPYLHELGRRWEGGEVSVAQEHFASGVLRGRLLGLARDWAVGLGPRAVLACAPGEQHDLGLIAFGLALRARGWRIVYLGADTPVESVAEAARSSEPVFVVISAVSGDRFRDAARELHDLARRYELRLGGAGAAEVGTDLDAYALSGDPVEEAERLTALAANGG
jgi:DNA-binding transcriptional MerR regulator